MKKFLTLFAIAVALATPAKVFADSSCTPIYGGGQSCVQSGNIMINKKVETPSHQNGKFTNVFQDNLTINDDKYNPGETIRFQLAVTNTGGSALSNVTVQDVLPGTVSFVSISPTPSNFDTNKRPITFTIGNLNPNETQTFTITGTVVSNSQLTQGITCDINQSTSSANSQTSQDNAQFCIQNQVLGTAVPSTQTPTTTKGGLQVFPAPSVTTTPKTGPEAIALLALLPTGLLGQILRKSAKGGSK